MDFLERVFMKRRHFLHGVAGLVTGALALRSSSATAQTSAETAPSQRFGGSETAKPKPGTSAAGIVPVQTVDLVDLPYEIDNGVKVFRLTAEPVKQEVLPGRVFNLWGYNGSAPGPTIQVTQGDRVRILFENRLPEGTTMHWHGLEVPINMDGAPGISQPIVEPGGRYTYEFTLHQHGTFFYHSHMAMQEMMGMIGMFIIHPRQSYQPRVDKDYAIVLQEYAVLPNNSIPNSLSMEFNWLTFNGKAGPASTPLIIKQGERVRIRIVNLGMDHHPIHLHGHQFVVTGTEGGRIPLSAQYAENTVLVGVAQARTIEFVAEFLGDWMLHCHLPHHMMNAMVSMVGPISMNHGGMQPGSMESGMGVARQGSALSEERGPALGRTIGLTTSEMPVSNMVGMQQQPNMGGHAGHGAMAPDAKRVPGFPQDMFMVMDDEVAKPETYGMAPGWTGGMQGMMTAVRILPPDKYEDIMRRIAEAKKNPPQRKAAPAPEPGHGSPGHRH